MYTSALFTGYILYNQEIETEATMCFAFTAEGKIRKQESTDVGSEKHQQPSLHFCAGANIKKWVTQ